MTQKKLEIIGPYTPEHEGPFCTRDGRPARIICTDRKSSNGHSIVALVDDGDQEMNRAFNPRGKYCLGDRDFDLMNAREVPVAREFWIVKHDREINQYSTYVTERAAQCVLGNTPDARAIIHARELLPGAGA